MTGQRCLTRLKRSFFPVFCLVFTLVGYGPAELYLSNRGSEEFWFSFSEILWPIVIIGLAAYAIILGLLMVLPTKGYHCGMAVIIAAAALLLIQALFLPNNYGSLNGAQIEWGQYTGRLIYNTAIWLAVIAGAVFWAIRNWTGFRKTMQFAAAIILLIQAATLITTGITNNGTEKKTAAEDVYLTTENLYTVSEDRNTIVFILDAFDSQLMCDLLEAYPDELKASFEDFTFYHNTSGGATRTKYAIPYILTGKTNDTGGTYAEYITESFQKSPLFQELRTGKYSTGFYTEYGYVDRSQTEAIDNLSSGGKMQATSTWGLSQSVLKMTAFKYMPHVLKPVFWMYSFELADWRGGNAGDTAYRLDDLRFYRQLREQGLSVLDRKPAFRFIHLKGAHGPFVMDENLQSVPHEQSSSQQQGLGALRIVSEYLRQLKELGLYGKATIFVLADHGDNGYCQPNYEQNPLFMVKEAETKKAFSASDTRLSYRDLPKMLASALQNNLKDPESKYMAEGTRYFYVGSEHDNTYQIIEYASDGDAYNAESYHRTDRSYTNQNTDTSYALGTTLYFGESGGSTAKKHFLSGFTYPESSYVWTNGNEAEMSFSIGNAEQNLLLSLDYLSVQNQYQRFYLYAGNELFASNIARNAEAHQYVIPKEAVTNGVLNIKIYLPDAISPLKAGTGVDGRVLGIAFHTMKINLTELPFEAEKQLTIREYNLGQEITFGEDGNMSDYAISGISQDHWTNGKTVTIQFDEIQADTDLKLTMAYQTYGEQQHVIIFANGEKIADYTAAGSEEKDWTIPKTLLKDGKLKLEIGLPDAKQPDNGDARELGLWMRKMVLQ